MKTYLFPNAPVEYLARGMVAMSARTRGSLALLLAFIAEFDAQRAYLPEAYPSMVAYCMGKLQMTNDEALSRIRVARKALQYPEIFAALADGRLNLTAINLLGPHLTPGNASALLEAAAHKSKCEIEALLAARSPVSESLPLVTVIRGTQVVPERVGMHETAVEREVEVVLERVGMHGPVGDREVEVVPERVGMHGSHAANPTEVVPERPGMHGSARVASPRRHPSRVVPIAAERYRLELTMGSDLRDKLQYAAELLGHLVPSGDTAQVIERGLDALIARLEKQKFGATQRPVRDPRPTQSARHVPAHVKREVRQRDQGRCSFVSDSGHRCASRTRLEYDHIEPVAHGGQATVDNIRLRCRVHNQYEAERTFGERFMESKREVARHDRGNAKSRGCG